MGRLDPRQGRCHGVRSWYAMPAWLILNAERNLPFSAHYILKKETQGQRTAPARVDAMNSVAARSFGVSASVMRPTSPYLKTPPLAHSTTSPIACFLVVATQRALSGTRCEAG